MSDDRKPHLFTRQGDKVRCFSSRRQVLFGIPVIRKWSALYSDGQRVISCVLLYGRFSPTLGKLFPALEGCIPQNIISQGVEEDITQDLGGTISNGKNHQ
ncbi:hypothetical protein AVEN_234266-1 [Araneus ventricosus]|uniref:Uncharacterized protein n=1 Tax=Araneus ventricosus TaxID=182803 RepID=A0A4Y2A9A6_ARAVE|nr:hypothetical protein AVEN_234266-1 [Araneus ventricosus]